MASELSAPAHQSALRETRTLTPLLALAPEASLSTNFSIRARRWVYQFRPPAMTGMSGWPSGRVREIVTEASPLDNETSRMQECVLL